MIGAVTDMINPKNKWFILVQVSFYKKINPDIKWPSWQLAYGQVGKWDNKEFIVKFHLCKYVSVWAQTKAAKAKNTCVSEDAVLFLILCFVMKTTISFYLACVSCNSITMCRILIWADELFLWEARDETEDCLASGDQFWNRKRKEKCARNAEQNLVKLNKRNCACEKSVVEMAGEQKSVRSKCERFQRSRDLITENGKGMKKPW